MERSLAMQRIQRQNDILQQFHMKLRADTDPEPVTNYLYQAKIIDENALEEILSMQTRRNKNKALLIKLRKVEDPNAFSEFVNGSEKEQPHLACILLKEENSRIYKLEKELVTVKTERLLVLETEKEELKTKCKSLEEQLQFWRRTLQDSNLERSGYDERSGAATLSVNEGDNIREPLTSLENGDLETPLFDNSTRRQSQGMGQGQRSRPSTRLRNEFTKTKEYHFRHVRDFDEGVIHYLGLNAGVSKWRNPARVPSSGVKVTYRDGKGREDPENILEYFNPVNSYTRSGWCLDLGKYYSLRLTDYTLRQRGSNSKNFLQNFKIQGRLNDDDEWSLLNRHYKVNWKLREWSYYGKSGDKIKPVPCKTKTWSVEGELKAHRQFQIVQLRDSMPAGAPQMSLAGIELYGVLSVPDFD